MNIDIKDIDKTKLYVVGVSGGPDSMALLDMAFSNGLNVIVGHVNYKRRETADRDQMLVEGYCDKHNLTFESLTAGKHHGNFQKWARDIRYRFFKHLVDKHHAEGVMIAHHQDDLIETYLLQKKRRQIPLYWGIRDKVSIDGLRIYRPLLTLSKDEIIRYCINHRIDYGKDETNDSDDYTRNKIRHEIVEKLSKKEKDDLVKKIEHANETLLARQELVNVEVKRLVEEFDVDHFLALNKNLQRETIRKFLMDKGINTKHYSIAHLNELLNFIRKKGNHEIALDDKHMFALSYGNILIYEPNKLTYHYRIDKLENIKTPYFKISDHGELINGVTISKEDLPLTIRSWQADDMIELRFGHKKINRWFIDRKIAIDQRLSWPIVLNKNQEVILVPKIGCNVAHFSNNPNLFVLKL